MDEKLRKAMTEFITQRLGDLGTDAPDPVTEVINNVEHCSKRLAAVLTEEQLKLWVALENALSVQVGEETRYYYTEGFNDALHFLLGWGRL